MGYTKEGIKMKRTLSLLLAVLIVLSVPVTVLADNYGSEVLTRLQNSGEIQFKSSLDGIEVTIPDDIGLDYVPHLSMALAHDMISEDMKARYHEAATKLDYSELVVRVYEKLTGKEIQERRKFKDTTSIYAEKVAGLGIMSGVGDGTFRPDEVLTREQAYVVVCNLLEKLNYDFYTPAIIVYDYDQVYEEVHEQLTELGVSNWALKKMIKVCMETVLFDHSSYGFDPKGSYTVLEGVYQMMRVFEKVDMVKYEGYTGYAEQVKAAIKDIKKIYPHGMTWGYEKLYVWEARKNNHGIGCAAFAGIMSDYIFGGDLPLRNAGSKFGEIRVGDVVVVRGGGHIAVVIDKTDKGIIIAEGNYGDNKVNWGRLYTQERFEKEEGSAMTRYPEVNVQIMPNAVPVITPVIINDTPVKFDAYTINGDKYFKLRDLAKALSNTSKEFDVDIEIEGADIFTSIKSKTPFKPYGNEMAKGDEKAKWMPITSKLIYVNGKKITLDTYGINNEIYYNLKDIAGILDIKVGINSTSQAIKIETD